MKSISFEWYIVLENRLFLWYIVTSNHFLCLMESYSFLLPKLTVTAHRSWGPPGGVLCNLCCIVNLCIFAHVKQWAAVKIQRLPIMVPPQKWKSYAFCWMLTCKIICKNYQNIEILQIGWKANRVYRLMDELTD